MHPPADHDEAREAKELVQQFLSRLEDRDLAGAEALLAPDAQMIFPGGVSFKHLAELIEWAKPRYRRVAKRIERIDATDADEGSIVICQGVLYGEWPDGQAFDDIRFADWFLIRNGLIQRQHVWNDLAETIAKRPSQAS